MRVSVLMEDTSRDSRFLCEHGLSLYLETEEHKILFDTGKSGLFLENAAWMGIDLSKVELGVLSHGHYDHGGGLAAFFSQNRTAPVYLHTGAEQGHFSRRKTGKVEPIGISLPEGEEGRFVFVSGDRALGPGLLLFDSAGREFPLPESNQVLLVREGEAYCCDPFVHEQSLLVQEGESWVLIAGCAHRGIVNILRRGQELTGGNIRAVIGGFHLSNPSAGTSVPEEEIFSVGQQLARYPKVRYLTGHCTGEEAYERLRPLLGERICRISSGQVLEV